MPIKEGRHEQIQQDIRELHRFGYAQELLRDMGGFANFAVSFTIISILTGAATIYGHGLIYGGPAVNGIGWPLVTLFTLFVAASMAEIASAVPTAGAMYHWSSILGGPGWGWFTAWFNFVGQMAITAGIDYGIAQLMANLLGWEGRTGLLLLYAGLLVSHGIFNHYGIRAVAFLNDVSVWYHIAGTVLLAAVYLFFADLQPLSFAFKTRFTASEYPYWWAFLVGLLQAQWIYTGYDASAHITEETVDPRRNAPRGMIMAILVSGACGYVVLLAITLAIKDLPAAAAAANPFLYIAQQALGSRLGAALVWSMLPAMWFCGLSSVTANARMVFSFARDNGLPGSRFLAKVSPRYRTPASAVWLSVALAFAVALYSGAFSVITSISTIGLYVSYIIPVILVLKARSDGRWGRGEFALGPWNLGRWGKLVNWVAVAWTGFITILFVAPPNLLTGYTFAGLTVILCGYWWFWMRGRFKGPQKVGTESQLAGLEHALEKTAVYHEA